MFRNKIPDKITKISKSSRQKTSEKVRNETENMGPDRKIPRERFIFPEKRQQNTGKLKLI